jgi:hypothetical protein
MHSDTTFSQRGGGGLVGQCQERRSRNAVSVCVLQRKNGVPAHSVTILPLIIMIYNIVLTENVSLSNISVVDTC